MMPVVRAGLVLVGIFTVLTGIFYPLAVMYGGQMLFPHQAEGSLIKDGNTVLGSALIGQEFTQEKYFHARPSAAGNGYDAASSSGSNGAPSRTEWAEQVKQRVGALNAESQSIRVPVDLVTASASGLDPHLSIDAAKYQAGRVAQARHISVLEVEKLIADYSEKRTWGILGEARVNVFLLNRALDALPSVGAVP